MITLTPLKRRLLYVSIFELLAIVLSTVILMYLSDSQVKDSLPLAVIVSLAAVVWNFIFNTIFEYAEHYFEIKQRSFVVRSAHALGFEGGLVLICLPLYMYWYQVGLRQAFMMEIALLIFFLFYTFIFTLIFDQIFTRTQ